MPDPTPTFAYRVVDREQLEAVRPLWEKLRAYHSTLPWHFANEMPGSAFEPRKQELLAKSATGKLRIELACAITESADVGYCVSTITADGRGELDSLFVDARFRGQGVGSELIRHALAWMDGLAASSKVVTVAYANEEALALYRRFGFHPRTILLQQQQKSET